MLCAPALAAASDVSARTRVACRKPNASFDSAIARAVAAVAFVWPLPHSLVAAVIQQESAFRPDAVSAAGAIGLMQLLPANAERVGLPPEALFSPTENILAGTRLLAVLLKHYRGDVISALVAYNAGPRRPRAPLPDNGETPAYVRAVLSSWTMYERCASARPEGISKKTK
jgi:soluble lytic murein transglycosylase-like protein